MDKAIPKSHWPSHTLKTEQHVWKSALSTKIQIITIITPLFMAIATALGISLHRGTTITKNMRKRQTSRWALRLAYTLPHLATSPQCILELIWTQRWKEPLQISSAVHYGWRSLCGVNTCRSSGEAVAKCNIVEWKNGETLAFLNRRDTLILKLADKDWMWWILGRRQVSCSKKSTGKEDYLW